MIISRIIFHQTEGKRFRIISIPMRIFYITTRVSSGLTGQNFSPMARVFCPQVRRPIPGTRIINAFHRL